MIQRERISKWVIKEQALGLAFLFYDAVILQHQGYNNRYGSGSTHGDTKQTC
jgi:hypothetical protein